MPMLQGAIMGLVASGGADYTQTLTGWRLKDSGSGNQSNVLAGFTYQIGNFQIAPNFLWQKPLVGPMPNGTMLPEDYEILLMILLLLGITGRQQRENCC